MKKINYYLFKRIIVVSILSCILLSLSITTVHATKEARLLDFQKNRLETLAKKIKSCKTEYSQDKDINLRELLKDTEKLSSSSKSVINKFGNKSKVNISNLYNRLNLFKR